MKHVRLHSARDCSSTSGCLPGMAGLGVSNIAFQQAGGWERSLPLVAAQASSPGSCLAACTIPMVYAPLVYVVSTPSAQKQH